MARPVKRRRICCLPEVTEFIPGDGKAEGTVTMTMDEFEAVRLIDRLGLSQEDCAAQMNVARTTVQNIYDSVRKKLAQVLVDGKSGDSRWPLSARTAGGRLVHLVGDEASIGRFKTAKITESNTWALFGELTE